MDQRSIEVNLTGEGVRPGSIRSRDIAKIITSVEDMIAAMLAQDDPGIPKEEVIVGLSAISQGSLALRFEAPLTHAATAAYERIIGAINAAAFDRLPGAAVTAIHELVAVSRRCNTDVELQSRDETVHLVAVISPDTCILPATHIAEQTILYGEVSRVGGDEPKVRVKLIDGNALSCSVSRTLARQLAGRLYEVIAMRGLAQWRTSDFTLDGFTIEEILPFRHKPAGEAFAALRELGLAAYVNGITDVPQHVRRLRGAGGDIG